MKKIDDSADGEQQLLRMEQRPLLEELKSVGVDVESVWKLVNRPNDYNQALPILIKHLRIKYSDTTTSGLVRAISISAAKKYEPAALLIDLFKSYQDQTTTGVKWVIGNALTILATKKDLPLLIEIVSDSAHGLSRRQLIKTIYRLGKNRPEVILLLEHLEIEPDIVGQEARRVLERHRTTSK